MGRRGVALQVAKPPPFFKIIARIAKRYQPKLARAFTAAMRQVQGQIDMAALSQAAASKHVRQIEAALHTGGNVQTILEGKRFDKLLLGSSTATGRAGSDVLSSALGVDVRFNALHPRVVMAARTQTADLVVEIGAQTREAIRTVIALGQGMGLTVEQQARALREVVGLSSNLAGAPLALRQEIERGELAAATSRRLSAADVAMIKSRIKNGTVTPEFLDQMEARYSERLLNYRSLMIASTETRRSSHIGQREGWKQAVEQKALPKTAVRMWIVVPDERLSFEHSLIPGMNPNGRGLDEPFKTPDGPFMDPPIRPNCRCGVGLTFPGFDGVL